MDSHHYSFKSDSGSDHHELDDEVYRRQTRKRLIIIVLSTAIFMAVTINAVVGIVVPQKNTKSSNPTPWQPPPLAAASNDNYSTGSSVQEMCNNMTFYPYTCTSSIASLLGSDNGSDQNLDPKQFFILSMQVSLNELVNISSSVLSSKGYANLSSADNAVLSGALDDCQTLLKDAIGHINKSIASVQVGQGKVVLSTDNVNDIRVWLNAAITDQKTCLVGLKKFANQTALSGYVGNVPQNSKKFTRNSWEIASKLPTFLHNFQTPIRDRKLLRIDGGGDATRGNVWGCKFIHRISRRHGCKERQWWAYRPSIKLMGLFQRCSKKLTGLDQKLKSR
ncbi:hypothetical protein SLE2022_147420 [Rubroshorea leprosula]